MSKRTIIIGVIAILAFIVCIASLYFENRKTVDEAERIINGDDLPPLKPTKEKTVKAQTLTVIEPEKMNDNEQQ